MILIDLEDVQRISDLWKYEREAFIHPELTPDEEWAAMNDPLWFDKNPEKRYYPGPYLLRVNDEEAWLSRHGDHWTLAAKRARYVGVAQRKWTAYFDLYANELGVTPRTLLNRLTGLRRRLKKTPDVWYEWGEIYAWPDASGLVWDGLYNHPHLIAEERDGRRMVKHVPI